MSLQELPYHQVISLYHKKQTAAVEKNFQALKELKDTYPELFDHKIEKNIEEMIEQISCIRKSREFKEFLAKSSETEQQAIH